MSETKQNRIAIYSRVSTDGQDADNQLRQLREFAGKNGLQIVHEFVDRGISGGTADREQFQLMFQAAERKEFDSLLFWSMDRLTREGTRETLNHLHRLEQAGVGFRSLCEQYLDSTSIMKDVVLALLATMAKQEKIRISERTKAGLATARAHGQRLGRPGVEINVPKVREMRQQGHSGRQIARLLNLPQRSVARVLEAA